LLTYEIAARARWELGARHVEVLSVRRLDHLNVELAALGHSHGDRPVVLLDEVEREVVRHLQAAQAPTVTDAAARRAWQTALANVLGEAPVRATIAALDAREAAFKRLATWLVRLDVVAEPPTRFDDGRAVADELKRLLAPTPYASLARQDLRALEAASDALAAPPVRDVLLQARTWEAAATAAHEARHALESEELDAPKGFPLPSPVIETLGHLSDRFVGSIASELHAYVGELHDADAPPCLPLAGLAEQVRGRSAHATPHFYAAWLIFRELARATPGDAEVAAALERRCREAPTTVRNEIATLATRLLGRPFAPADEHR
jgi:hypothetical protein